MPIPIARTSGGENGDGAIEMTILSRISPSDRGAHDDGDDAHAPQRHLRGRRRARSV